MLGEARYVGICVRSDGWVVLVIVLGGNGILCALDPIEICHGLIGNEVSGAGSYCIFGKARGGRNAIGPRDQILAVGKLVLKECDGDRAHLTRGQRCAPLIVRDCGQARSKQRALAIGSSATIWAGEKRWREIGGN